MCFLLFMNSVVSFRGVLNLWFANDLAEVYSRLLRSKEAQLGLEHV